MSYRWVGLIGGDSVEVGWGVGGDDAGNIVSCGEFNDLGSFDPNSRRQERMSNGATDAYVVKLDSGGQFKWVATFGGSGYDYAWSVAADRDGNVLATGEFWYDVDFDPGEGVEIRTSNGDTDAFLVKLDPFGNLLWVKTIGGALGDSAYPVMADAEGNVYIAGRFDGVVDFNPDGGGDFHGLEDRAGAFFTQYSPDGDYLWTKVIVSPSGYAAINALSFDRQERIVLVGGFLGTCDFDPGTGVDHKSAIGRGSAYVTYLSASGDYIMTDVFGGPDFDLAIAAATDSVGGVYAGGRFSSASIDFDPSSGEDVQQNHGEPDFFVSKYECGACEFLDRHDLSVHDHDLVSTLYTTAAGGSITVTADGPDGAISTTERIGRDGIVRVRFSDLLPGDYTVHVDAIVDESGNVSCSGSFSERTATISD